MRYQFRRAANRSGKSRIRPSTGVSAAKLMNESVADLPVLVGFGFLVGSESMMFSRLLRSGVAHTTPAEKSPTNFGTAASKPDTSNMPASVGSAMEKFVAVIATTTSRASMPVLRRYSSSAW